jgi:hypothetical protein
MDHLAKNYMPDGKTKQCFALETSQKIALSWTVMDADEKPTFKQTSHFRAYVPDDIVEQIASRNSGTFYNSCKGSTFMLSKSIF